LTRRRENRLPGRIAGSAWLFVYQPPEAESETDSQTAFSRSDGLSRIAVRGTTFTLAPLAFASLDAVRGTRILLAAVFSTSAVTAPAFGAA
jgi:hypothetical protein